MSDDHGLPLAELRQQAERTCCERVAELEREVQVLHTRLDAMNDSLERLENGANKDVSTTAREAMLPVHRMWADIRAGDADTLGKGERRAATLFGAVIRRVVDGPATDDEFLPYNGVDALRSDLLSDEHGGPQDSRGSAPRPGDDVLGDRRTRL